MSKSLRISASAGIIISLLALSGCDETSKGTLAGGAIGAGAGAGIGALAGNAALGAGIGGAVGLLGGYLHERNSN